MLLGIKVRLLRWVIPGVGSLRVDGTHVILTHRLGNKAR